MKRTEERRYSSIKTDENAKAAIKETRKERER